MTHIASIMASVFVLYANAVFGSVSERNAVVHKNVVETNEQPQYRERQIIVKYRDGGYGNSSYSIESRHGVKSRKQVFKNMKALENVFILDLEEDANIESISAELSKNSAVEYAQPNYIVEKLSDDTYFDMLWGVDLVRAPDAWGITEGEGVIVAVVDTGVDYNHPDLVANAWVDPSLVQDANDDGVVDYLDLDTNGNGRISKNEMVDGAFGWDFSECKRRRSRRGGCWEKPPDGDPYDKDGHGTHVSGTIAAVANNGLGVAGVAPRAKIMAIKGLTDDGWGEVTWLAAGIMYAADHGAAVINNSWGCGGCPSNPIVEDAVRYARSKGATVVFAAGNGAADTRNSSPQNMQKVITVSACTPSERPTFFTNYGVTVDVCAPGGGDVNENMSEDEFYLSLFNVLSLRAKKGRSFKHFWPSRCVQDRGYACSAGTSMAAPHISGVVALIRSFRPYFSPDEVEAVIRGSARDINTPWFDLYAGAGMADVNRALMVSSPIRVRLSGDRSMHDSAQGTIALRGMVEGSGLVSYQLYYGVGFTPIEWQPIGLPQAHEVSGPDGELGQWDISNLETSAYVVRLAATSIEGFVFESIARMYIEPTPRELTPNDSDSQQMHSVGGNTAVWYEPQGTRIFDFSANSDYWMPGSVVRTNGNVSPKGNIVIEQWSYTRENYDVAYYRAGSDSVELFQEDDIQQFNPKIGIDYAGNEWAVWLDCSDRATQNACSFHALRQIIERNIATGEEHVITDRLESRSRPDTGGDLVAWMEYVDRIWRVAVYRRSTGEIWFPDISESRDQYSPAIDDYNPIVVWNEADNGINRIRVYKADTKELRWLNNDTSSHQRYPEIANGNVVFMDNTFKNWDVRLQNVFTGKNQFITSHPANQTFPAITAIPGGLRLLWSDARWPNGRWHATATEVFE